MTARTIRSDGPSAGRSGSAFGGRLAVGGLAVIAAASLAACGSDSKDGAGSSSGSSSSAGDPRTVSITITSAGCAPKQTTYTSGPLTFKIDNKDATGVTE